MGKVGFVLHRFGNREYKFDLYLTGGVPITRYFIRTLHHTLINKLLLTKKFRKNFFMQK